ncbi:MAG: glycosyltransferase family 2 protein [Rhodobacteraceae bacterium]|nr:glycosyltransferase family 2 protein [Paracoccaceae bacterium]
MTPPLATTSCWGLCSTIKAPADEILRFAAHHLELGAHRLYIYLDDDNPAAFTPLKAHPKIRVTHCDTAYWKKQGARPKKHQVRQTKNATHAYNRRVEVDWLIHIDVDEFLWPDTNVADILTLLSSDIHCARARPIESIAGDGTLFKGYIPSGPDRAEIVRQIYPTFGAYIKGGFLSHVVGKLFVRTGKENVLLKIHNMFWNDEMNPGHTELNNLALCHCHSKNWQDWLSTYRYRLEKGSYRADLAPSTSGGVTLHDMFHQIENKHGEAGLRAFYDEVCADSEKLRKNLQTRGLLRQCDLELDRKAKKHFPDFF